MAEEDLICCHLTTNLFHESDNEEFSVSDEITYEPLVETVDEEVTLKFVYNDAEEPFPTANTCVEPKSMQDTGLGIKDISPVYEEHYKDIKQTVPLQNEWCGLSDDTRHLQWDVSWFSKRQGIKSVSSMPHLPYNTGWKAVLHPKMRMMLM